MTRSLDHQILSQPLRKVCRSYILLGDVILRRQHGHVLSHHYGHANFHAQADGVIAQS